MSRNKSKPSDVRSAQILIHTTEAIRAEVLRLARQRRWTISMLVQVAIEQYLAAESK